MPPIAIDRVAWLAVTVSPAKTVEPTQISFEMWTWVGPKNYVLDGGPDPHGRGTFEGDDVGIFLHATKHCSQWHDDFPTCCQPAFCSGWSQMQWSVTSEFHHLFWNRTFPSPDQQRWSTEELTIMCEFGRADQRRDLEGIVGIQRQRPGAHLCRFLGTGCTSLQYLPLLLLNCRRQSKVDLRTIFRFPAVDLCNNDTRKTTLKHMTTEANCAKLMARSVYN